MPARYCQLGGIGAAAAADAIVIAATPSFGRLAADLNLPTIPSFLGWRHHCGLPSHRDRLQPRGKGVRIVSDPREDTSLVIPIRGVFALQIVQRGDTLVARIVGHDDDDGAEVPESHLPPLPAVSEAPSPPYRRLLTDAQR